MPLAVLVLVTAFLVPLPGEAQTVPDRARAFLFRGDLDSAMALTDSSLTADSANPELWVIKARIHAARADTDGQIAALQAALKRFPSYPEALIAMTRVLVDSGLADSAASYLRPNLFRPGLTQIDAFYLQGRILESKGIPDSAIVMYRRAFEILDARDLLRFPPGPRQRLGQVSLRSAGGHASVWRAGRPTVFIFWATWSPQSLTAFREISTQIPRAGISWRYVPVNVDALHPSRDAKAAIVQQARVLGYKDTVWIDHDLALFRSWNIDRVPTVIVTNLSGEIDAVRSGWSEDFRDLMLNRYLGSYADTIPAEPSLTSPGRTKAQNLLAAARMAGENGNLQQAVKQSANAVKADPDFALAHVTLAAWRWIRGDTLGARMAAYNAMKADSANPWSCLAVARIEYLHGHEQTALGLMTRAIAQDSGLVPAWRILGRSAAGLGAAETAVTALRAIEQLNKLDSDLPVLRALITSADDPVHAATAWRQAVEARL